MEFRQIRDDSNNRLNKLLQYIKIGESIEYPHSKIGVNILVLGRQAFIDSNFIKSSFLKESITDFEMLSVQSILSDKEFVCETFSGEKLKLAEMILMNYGKQIYPSVGIGEKPNSYKIIGSSNGKYRYADITIDDISINGYYIGLKEALPQSNEIIEELIDEEILNEISKIYFYDVNNDVLIRRFLNSMQPKNMGLDNEVIKSHSKFFKFIKDIFVIRYIFSTIFLKCNDYRLYLNDLDFYKEINITNYIQNNSKLNEFVASRLNVILGIVIENTGNVFKQWVYSEDVNSIIQPNININNLIELSNELVILLNRILNDLLNLFDINNLDERQKSYEDLMSLVDSKSCKIVQEDTSIIDNIINNVVIETVKNNINLTDALFFNENKKNNKKEKANFHIPGLSKIIEKDLGKSFYK